MGTIENSLVVAWPLVEHSTEKDVFRIDAKKQRQLIVIVDPAEWTAAPIRFESPLRQAVQREMNARVGATTDLDVVKLKAVCGAWNVPLSCRCPACPPISFPRLRFVLAPHSRSPIGAQSSGPASLVPRNVLQRRLASCTSQRFGRSTAPRVRIRD